MNQASVALFPLSNYSFGDKDPQHNPEAGDNMTKKMMALKKDFEDFGGRITVEAVIIVHEHECPHLLLFSAGNNYYTLF